MIWDLPVPRHMGSASPLLKAYLTSSQPGGEQHHLWKRLTGHLLPEQAEAEPGTLGSLPH